MIILVAGAVVCLLAIIVCNVIKASKIIDAFLDHLEREHIDYKQAPRLLFNSLPTLTVLPVRNKQPIATKVENAPKNLA
jgi:hypothetical protein